MGNNRCIVGTVQGHIVFRKKGFLGYCDLLLALIEITLQTRKTLQCNVSEGHEPFMEIDQQSNT